MKIVICNELFQGWPIERVFEYAAQLSYDRVEIAPYTKAFQCDADPQTIASRSKPDRSKASHGASSGDF
jgi:sugar phosphate isomerase/epimerase